MKEKSAGINRNGVGIHYDKRPRPEYHWFTYDICLSWSLRSERSWEL